MERSDEPTQGRIQDLWKGGGAQRRSRLKTLFGISKGGRAPPAPPPLNPLVPRAGIVRLHSSAAGAIDAEQTDQLPFNGG